MTVDPRAIGVVIPGGGVTGAMYQVGCLAALEDSLPGFHADKVRLFVGTSSGATVAAALAGGIPVQRLYRALLDPADDFFPLERKHLLELDIDEWKRVLRSSTGAVRRLLLSVTTRPTKLDVWQEIERFYDSLPTGIFRLDALERFLAEFFQRRGIPNEFDKMPTPLFVSANDLDTGDRVMFGDEGWRHVPVSQALCASSALPPFYAPFTIDGRDFVDGGVGRVASVDVAVRHGCDLVFIVNPMVPVRLDRGERVVPTGHGRMQHVRDKGFLWAYNQAFRMSVRTRLHLQLELSRLQHPDVTLVMLEPEDTDATMFMYAPMNFAARRTILQYGYTTTIRKVRDIAPALRGPFEAHGIRVT